MTDEADCDIGFLSASPVRTDVLERLADDAARPADLVEYADVSRTTVHRTLTELVDRNWVRRVDDGYAITGAGELALRAYRDTRTRFRTLDRFEPFLVHADAAAEIDLNWLEEARLETASDENPHRPIEWYADRLAEVEGDDLRGTTPVISRRFMEVHAPIVFEGLPVELVIDEATFRAVSDRYPDELRKSLSLEEYDLYVAEESPSVGITLYGRTVLLGAYDDGRRLVAVAESTNSRLREWAENRFCRYRSRARRVTGDAIAASD